MSDWPLERVVTAFKVSGYGVDDEPMPRDMMEKVKLQALEHARATFGDDPKMLEAIRQHYEEIENTSPDQQLRNFLMSMWGMIQENSEQNCRSISYQPAVDVVEHGIVNGFAIRGTDGHFGVLIDASVLSFANLLCKFFGEAMYSGTEGGQAQYSTDAEFVVTRAIEGGSIERLLELYTAYIVGRRPTDAKQYWPSPEATHLSNILRDCMELFILGHEYGHLQANHLQTESVRFAFGDTEADIELCKRSLMQEAAADWFGFVTLIELMNKRRFDPFFPAMAVALFFAALSTVMDMVVHLVSPDAQEPEPGQELNRFAQHGGSHPPGLVRIALLARALEQTDLPAEAKSSAQSGFEKALEIWGKIELVLLDYAKHLKSQGARPHSRWVQSMTPAV